MDITSRIYVAGHRGMVGSAIWRTLMHQGFTRLIGRTHSELDLISQADVREFFEQEKPDYVILAAAKVGGIHANNTLPAHFIYQNLMIEANVIHEAWRCGVSRLLFLGSSCIYPKFASQPMSESALLTGPLEPTNEPYAVAKISGIKLCESYNRQYGTDFRSVMPTNLYGPGDNFHPENSHVVPALMRRFHEARVAGKDRVTIWGTGIPRREFLYVEDMAAASVHVMMLDKSLYDAHTEPMCSHINVGSGQDCTIRDLGKIMAEVVGFSGKIEFDPSKPDGTPCKLLDISTISSLGWQPAVSLREGLKKTYEWYQAVAVSNEI